MKKTIILTGILCSFNLMNSFSQCLPIAFYPLNNEVRDVSGSGFHAANNGTITTTDKFGHPTTAMSFDGSNDYIEFPDDFDYNNTTINLWFKAESSNATPKTIFDNDNPNLVNGARKMFILDNGGNPAIYFSTGAGSTNVHAENIVLNTWYMATIAVDANVRYYLNGNLVATFSLNGSNTTSGSMFAHLGCTRLIDRFFDGDIDNLSIYNCALSQQAIDDLYNAGNSCLQVEHLLNADILDNSDNGLNAINHGATPTTDKFGNSNSAMTFDGVDDYIELADDYDFNNTTINLWFKADSYDVNPKTIYDNDNPDLVNGSRKMFILDNGGNPAIYFSTGAGSTNVHAENIVLNTWYMATMVVDANVRYYLNSNLVATFSLNGSNTTSGSPVSNLGCTRLIDRFFDGDIDNVSIFDCALSQAQIDSMYAVFLKVDEFNKNEITFSVYPNPTDNSLTLVLPDNLITENYTIIDATGRVIRNEQLSGNTIDVSGLSNGVYFLDLSIEGNSYRKKFIKN